MRTFISIALAVGCLLALAGPVFAQTPTGGSVGEYAPGTSLTYRFGGATYPGAIQSAIQTALGSDWSNATWNNSRLPRFNYGVGGSGQVVYSSSISSPCNTGHTDWLQCASNWGSQSFRIYIRNFAMAPHGAWTWCNLSYSGTCWDIERALMHEVEHVTMGVGNHDGQGESNTVMGAVSPWYANFGWNTHHIQRCDLAAAQFLYGLQFSSGPLADCFNAVTGHGSVGLIPSITSTSSTIVVCRSQNAILSGSFGVNADYRYQALSGQRLAGRTLWFDRKPHASTTWTLNVASAVTGVGGTNWSRAFSTSSISTITYDFRAHTSSETGLDGAAGPLITVTWRSGC